MDNTATHTFHTLEGHLRYARNVEFTPRGVQCEFSPDQEHWIQGIWDEDILGGDKTFKAIQPEQPETVCTHILINPTAAYELSNPRYRAGINDEPAVEAEYRVLSADYNMGWAGVVGMFYLNDATLIPDPRRA